MILVSSVSASLIASVREAWPPNPCTDECALAADTWTPQRPPLQRLPATAKTFISLMVGARAVRIFFVDPRNLWLAPRPKTEMEL